MSTSERFIIVVIILVLIILVLVAVPRAVKPKPEAEIPWARMDGGPHETPTCWVVFKNEKHSVIPKGASGCLIETGDGKLYDYSGPCSDIPDRVIVYRNHLFQCEEAKP